MTGVSLMKELSFCAMSAQVASRYDDNGLGFDFFERLINF